ncbi:MAG: hypothetical protein AAFQ43_00185 [Bacteroidota bacterium]
MRVFTAVVLFVALAAAPLSAQDLASGAPEADMGAIESLVVLRTADLAPGAEVAVQDVQSAFAGDDIEILEVTPTEGPNTGTRFVMALGGTLAAGAFGAAALDGEHPWLFWFTPLAGGATTYALGEVMGYRGDPLRSLGATALGAIPGAVVVGVAIAIEEEGDAWVTPEGVVTFLAGYGLYATVPSVLAARAHTVSPTVLRGPDGAASPGLSLTVDL